MGIFGTLLGRREPEVKFRTVDGGHPAPFPDMTDEQLYNYEVTFDVPNRTFDEPPRPVRTESKTVRREPTTQKNESETREMPRDPFVDPARRHARPAQPATAPQAASQKDLPPLDLAKPVRLITTKQPVEILTTRARHPVYKVHGYIGDDDVVTVFTLDGRLSENGPRFLENVPQHRQLYLNVYQNPDPLGNEKYLITQHETKAQADSAAKTGRIACVPLQFDL
ncbi:hypothetical protein EGT07_04105 [Herbaspirillum sp. HC18]|nr:hypothetical protein EGT07_04105 [Herbaspirillum sp. HC18]